MTTRPASNPTNPSPHHASIWPAGIQCAVLITFDLDAETGWMSRDPEKELLPVLFSQGRFGPKVGVPLLLDLLRESELRSTFFVPSRVAELYPRTIESICAAECEIGAHGHIHEIPGTFPAAREEEILVKSMGILQSATGKRPVGYRAPFGQLSAASMGLLEKHGFEYGSNMMDDVFPYMHAPAAGSTPLVELPIHWVLVDATFMQFGAASTNRPIYSASQVLTIWKEEFDGIYECGGLMTLVLHPEIIGRPSRVRMLRELISYIRRVPGVWMPRAFEVAEYWRKRNQTIETSAKTLVA